MKRALSLIIVLAMVLCMIPFSAFAADFGTAEAFVDGVITLVGSEEKTYLWTATEDGTLAIFADAVIPEVAEGEEIPALAEPYILVDGDDYSELYAETGVTVEAGQSYEITIGDDAMIGGDVNVYTIFKGLPGTETNPKVLSYPLTPMYPDPTTDSIEPGVTEYYVLQGYAGQDVVISGLGVKVVTVADGEIYGGEATTESVSFTVPAAYEGGMNYVLKITNKTEVAQVYTVSAVVKVGTMDNPEVVVAGEYQQELAAGNQGYYYTYFAEGDGTVTVNLYAQDAEGNTLGTMLNVNNLTSYIYGDQTTDGYWSVEVSEGDEIMIMAATFNEADMWNAPAGTITTVIAFSEETEEPEVGIDWGSILDGVTSHTNNTEADVLYTYTVEKDGLLFRSDYGWNMLVSAGETVNVNIMPGETVEMYYASPIAMIGDVEYYYLDEAIVSAMAGDTIVLLDDVVSEWDGISLKPGINLNLGEFTLTAPYVIAFGEVTGVVGSASIVADNVMLNNVTIGGVEYAWTAGDGAYTLVEYKAPVIGTEEPIVAEYNKQNYSLSEAIALAAANASKGNEQTVKLIANVDMPDATIIIEPYVILDTYSFSITAKNIVGLNGSSLQNTKTRFNGTNLAAAGQINVAKNNMILSETTVKPSSTTSMKVMPFWLPESNCYTLGNLRMNDDKITKTQENDSVRLGQFYHQGAGTLDEAVFFDNGSTDHGIRIVMRAEWTTDTGAITNDYTYLDSFVKEVANPDTSMVYTYTLTGLTTALEVDTTYGPFKLTPMIITDCGAIYYGNTIEYTNLI